MVDSRPPDDAADFFPWLKRASEQLWAGVSLDPRVYGFQIPPGARWRPGLTGDQVRAYEAALGFRFPDVYRRFLAHMNGTAPASVNVYGGCGQAPAYAPGYYSYPDDLGAVRDRLRWIHEEFGLTPAEADRRKVPHLIPLVGHRFLVADRCASHPVLSMYGTDVMLYASSLEGFLVSDIFDRHQPEPGARDVSVAFWHGAGAATDEADGAALWSAYLARQKQDGSERPGVAPFDGE